MRLPRPSLAIVGTLAATGLLTTACSGAERPQLTVGAASSLEPLFMELAERFEEAHDVDVVLVFSASGTLARQIEQGAPIDVFASADTAFMEELTDQALVDHSTVEIFGLGKLVVVAARESDAGSGAMVQQITDARRIAIANPEIAPYGAAAKSLLEGSGIWADIKDRVVYGQNAAQVLHFVQSGDADFGLVPVSLVFGREVPGVVFPRDTGFGTADEHPLKQTIAIVSASAQWETAHRFIELLSAPDADALLARYGYEPIDVVSGG